MTTGEKESRGMNRDILERAKAQLAEGYTAINESIVRELISEVERLRSVEAQQLIALESTAFIVEHQAARIKELEAEHNLFCTPGSTLGAALVQLQEARERIEEFSALNESLMENGNDLRTRCQKAEARIKDLEAEAQEYHDKKEVVLTLLSKQNRYVMDLEKIKAEIGSGNHIVEVDQMVLTAEQREAMEYAIEVLHHTHCPECGILLMRADPTRAIEIIGNIIVEAGGKDESY